MMMKMTMRASGSDKILDSVKMMRMRKISIIHIHKIKSNAQQYMVSIPLVINTEHYFFFQVFTFKI